MLNALLLILSWTNESFHKTFLRYDQFPILIFPSGDEYWYKLSKTILFEDKSPAQLAQQMDILLVRLFYLSARRSLPAYIKLSPNFTPIQNVCLYMEVFGLDQNPLGAFQPLDTAKLVRALQPFSPSIDEMTICFQVQAWDNHIQRLLPINCPRSNEVGRSRPQDYYRLTSSR